MLIHREETLWKSLFLNIWRPHGRLHGKVMSNSGRISKPFKLEGCVSGSQRTEGTNRQLVKVSALLFWDT